MSNKSVSDGVKRLQQAFNNQLDPDVLVAILEMHGGDSRAALKFLQAQNNEQAYDVNTLSQNEGMPSDYPKPSSVTKVNASRHPKLPKDQEAVQELLRLFLSENVTLNDHYQMLKHATRKFDYLAVLMLLMEYNVEILKSTRPRVLAVLWATGHRSIAEYLLTKDELFGLPAILGALQLLDSARQIRAIEKRIARIEKQTGKVRATQMASMKTKIAELQKEVNIGSVSGALSKTIARWCSRIDRESLEYFALNMPTEPWKELADIVHLNPKKDFAISWFLPYMFGEQAPSDSAVALCKELSLSNLDSVLARYQVPYSYLRTKVKNIPNHLRPKVATYVPLDTLVWYYEELSCPEVDKILDQRLNKETPTFGYGKLCERLLYFQSLKGNSFFRKLMPVAEQKLKEIELKLEAPVVILGDASYSMDVSIRVSTVIASVLTALCNAQLRFFTDKNVVPDKLPKNVSDVLEMARTMKADGQTAPAASLWPYYEKKEVVKMFVVVTDEVENIKYRGMFFPELFKKYYNEVYPARIAFVSFLDNPSVKGRMVTALEAMGIVPLQFKLDGKRPDLTKLDHILAVLAMESKHFAEQVQSVAAVANKSVDGALQLVTGKKNKAQPGAGKQESNATSSTTTTTSSKRTEQPDDVSAVTASLAAAALSDTKVNNKNDNSVEQSKSKASSLAASQSIEKNEKQCVICLERVVTSALVDCGHFSFCHECAVPLKECPICRAEVIKVVRIYQN